METPASITNSSSGAGESLPANPSAMSIDKLFPALLECFGIILCGYIAGRAHIITATQSKGLGNFVGKFALPALLFKNMVLLDFGNVVWPFLWSVLIAKVSVFFLVGILTLLVASPESRFCKAGLFAIFATQSNDFALGYPIAEALYRNTHPEYLQYIYLVAPISLMLLNPIGFAFCEIQQWKDQRDQPRGRLHILGVVILQVLKNPIVFMVVIGIAAHFLLDRTIPAFMADFVDGLANSFGGAALFYLGLSMVGQLGQLTRSTVVALILLVTAKLLVMPLICRDMVELLDHSNASSANHSSLSNYAFLYGVFPTAPTVAIYAAQYNMELQVVTSGMVISTFLSAPIMYVSVWLLTIPGMDPNLLMNSLQHVRFDISIVSLVAVVWTIAVMFLSKKFKRLPHLFTINLFLAQFLTCIGMILWNFVVRRDGFIGQVLTFTLMYISLYSSYLWPGLIVLSLLLLRRNEELKLEPCILVMVGWGVPTVATAALLLAGEKTPNTIDSAFFYGRPQVMCTTAVLAVSILLSGASLVGLSRGSWDPDSYQILARAFGPTEDQGPEEERRGLFQPVPSTGSINGDVCACAPPAPDMMTGANMNDAPATPTGQCGSCSESTDSQRVREEQLSQAADKQTARHVLLCLLLAVIQLANISSCLWRLFNQTPGRLYLELQFFCAAVNYGQGFLSFAIFGLDKHLIILPFKKRIYRLWYRLRLEKQPDSPGDTSTTCSQFTSYHQDQCCEDLLQKRSSVQASGGPIPLALVYCFPQATSEE